MDGTSFLGKVLARAFNLLVVRDAEGRIFIVNMNNLVPWQRKELRGEE